PFARGPHAVLSALLEAGGRGLAHEFLGAALAGRLADQHALAVGADEELVGGGAVTAAVRPAVGPGHPVRGAATERGVHADQRAGGHGPTERRVLGRAREDAAGVDPVAALEIAAPDDPR